MASKARYEISVGVFVIVAACILGYISLKISWMRVRDGIEVSFLFPHACGLVEGGAVTVAGVEVGYIQCLELKDDKALVRTRLETAARLKNNITATIRSKSLLGEKYIEILPQSANAPLLRDGAFVTATERPVQIDEIIGWCGKCLDQIPPGEIALIVRTLAHDAPALHQLIQNLDALIVKISSLEPDQIRSFVNGLKIKARLF
jgi:phospholipid/cholesterol/gamma-HCH transport system substrate-binding protein